MPVSLSTTGTLIRLDPAADLQPLAAEWRALETQAKATFFTSWNWIGTWLETSRHDAALYVFRCKTGEQLNGLAILAHYTHRKRRLFTAQVLGLNQQTTAGLNMNIEYNGLLSRQGHETVVAESLLQTVQSMRRPAWNELMFDGITEAQWRNLQSASHRCYWRLDETLAPWIRSLHGIHTLDDVLAPLSRGRRWQIRRAIRHYERTAGPILCHGAKTTREALAWFQEMGVLHTKRWNRDGLPGSFANSVWVDFHRRLISHLFEREKVQLLKITAGEQTLGIIYSFLWHGHVYMLQTGFTEPRHNVERPGFIAHCLAMVYNAQRGMETYDFMCGDGDYKAALSQPGTPLYWVRARRNGFRNRIEDGLIDTYRALRSTRGR